MTRESSPLSCISPHTGEKKGREGKGGKLPREKREAGWSWTKEIHLSLTQGYICLIAVGGEGNPSFLLSVSLLPAYSTQCLPLLLKGWATPAKGRKGREGKEEGDANYHSSHGQTGVTILRRRSDRSGRGRGRREGGGLSQLRYITRKGGGEEEEVGGGAGSDYARWLVGREGKRRRAGRRRNLFLFSSLSLSLSFFLGI